MKSSHRHLHLNVERTMSHAHITADIEKAFGMGADTVGMCELETAWHHTEFRRVAKGHGYETFLPHFGQKGSALGLAVRRDYGHITAAHTTLCVPGRSHVSPSRYINRVRVKRTSDGVHVNVAETHQYSSGWTGPHALDAFRRLRWSVGMTVVTRVLRGVTDVNDVVIGAGDFNRPPGTFTRGRVLGALLDPKGMASAGYAHTDHTHGPTTFDYAFFLSKNLKVHVAHWATPAFHSDHDGVFVTFEWQPAPPVKPVI